MVYAFSNYLVYIYILWKEGRKELLDIDKA